MKITFVLSLFLSVGPTLVRAEEPAKPAAGEDSAEELAKKLTNPVASLVSIPFQANWQMGVGPDEASQFILNVQPVVPFSLNKEWNLIARAITPIVGQPPMTPGGPTPFGFGDILSSFFLSPAQPRGLIWGVGPVLSLPTSSDPYLGSGMWSAGPTLLLLKMSHGWTYGLLWNQVWSFAGPSNRNHVSQMFTQPFVAHTSKKAVTLTLSSEMIANWEGASGDQWTVPIIFQVSKLSWFGPFPASYQVGVGYYLDKPTGGPDWKLRANFTLLLPEKKK